MDFRGSAYCQLIRDVNKEKRLAWECEHLGEAFDDVIFTDECSVRMETHHRFCCRKQGQTPSSAVNLLGQLKPVTDIVITDG